MTCEHLVCANCAGPVNEGRCPVCRASRERIHREGGISVPPVVLAALVTLIVIAAVVAQRLAG
ncbi:hypothetical protein ACPA54_23310 [Uniformispora flossi]|jgi:hypothetical protein|uniref:RING-type domain-containing protein n=1 Tax=Yinghuangia aomiensis TaxID=676205 RepID=A0ABP9I766_9ACTN